MNEYNLVPNKKANIALDTNAFLQSRSDLNVTFSSADRDTAIFEFTVTQDKKPLLLGEANIKSSIVFIHSKGLKVRVPLEITDGMNGKISVKVPDDVLKLPGKVTSQVFVTRKTPDKTQAVVAERIFSFTIQESLAWEFDGETKLNYIIEFDELEEQLTQRVVAIEQAMANLEDYVQLVKDARDEGISDINIAKANSLQELNDLAAAKLSEITDKGEAYENIFNAIKSDVESNKQEVVETYNTFIQNHQDIVSDFRTIVSDYEEQVNTKLNGAVEQLNQNIIDGQLVNQTDIEDMETLTNAETKRSEVLSNAQTYTDNKVSERFKTLWSGSVSSTGVPITLNESYKKFHYVIMTYNFVGGIKNEIIDTTQMSYIYLQDMNMGDTTAGNPSLFEVKIKVESETELTIAHNHAYTIEGNKPLLDFNNVKIEKIVGVK
ncbi:BppU family phage baseplate upper protein [Mammaliicoccus sciuri]|uniref:BppU family phage baseplate upper protein n=1 Tax=Mammaliicoccus sciuri TaxID=1296 RepID=UPI002DBC3E7B|nr:BppU family phage baseplate upper protein [Mammaliicoccus sciuri]MEB5568397.1 phage baseplate upper protein [Mammaliicoccus sciuri]